MIRLPGTEPISMREIEDLEKMFCVVLIAARLTCSGSDADEHIMKRGYLLCRTPQFVSNTFPSSIELVPPMSAICRRR